jgi:hypothetical protein
MTETRLRRPNPSDLRAALALIAASLRGDDQAVTTLWDAAAEDDRQLMLCLALATYAKQPKYMADLMGDSPATALLNIARVTTALPQWTRMAPMMAPTRMIGTMRKNDHVSTNGQHRPQPRVSFDDTAVVARLAVCAFLHGDDEAREAIEQHRPDLDPDQLRLSIECSAMVFAHLLNMTNMRDVYFPGVK